MPLPVGTIYSSNITPDPKYGIGKYSFEEFDRAVRHGVAPGGKHLYPAMPFPSYAKATPEDMKALYAYFMQGVAPVAKANRPSTMVWPLTIRWPLAIRNWMYASNDQVFHQPRPGFPAAIYDWPKGGAPKDVRYCLVSLGNCTPAEIAKAPKPPGGK